MMNTYSGHTDEQLLALVIGSDGRAFEAIYSKYVSQLYRFAVRTIRSKEESREMVQEVFETLWRRRERIGHIRSLKSYLFGSMQHMIVRYIYNRKVKQRYETHYLFFEAVYDTMDKDEARPEAIREALYKSISELPKRCQMTIKLRLTEELSNDEIAERMNITKKTVENHITQALAHLRGSREKVLKRIQLVLSFFL